MFEVNFEFRSKKYFWDCGLCFLRKRLKRVSGIQNFFNVRSAKIQQFPRFSAIAVCTALSAADNCLSTDNNKSYNDRQHLSALIIADGSAILSSDHISVLSTNVIFSVLCIQRKLLEIQSNGNVDDWLNENLLFYNIPGLRKLPSKEHTYKWHTRNKVFPNPLKLRLNFNGLM